MSQTIIFEATPNPQAMKFIVTDRRICDETIQFQSAEEAKRSPLARKLFGFPWAKGVLLGPSFVTVTKQDWVNWEVLAEPLSNLIEEHLTRGEAVLLPPQEELVVSTTSKVQHDDPLVQQILQILEDEIRPAVAMDGGDVVFYKFEAGRVYLEMKGSCNGCPSAAMTLKDGIETRLKKAIPEIIEVLAI